MPSPTPTTPAGALALADYAGHSPAPWKYDKRPCAYGRDIRDAEGRWIGSAHNSHHGSGDFPSDAECEPNARLFADAPALAAELATLRARYEGLEQTLAFCVAQMEPLPMLWERGLASPERRYNEARTTVLNNARAALGKQATE